jgi:hypothetical protein
VILEVGVCRGKEIVTRHTSHVTRHTSHVTRHTSHVTCPPPSGQPSHRRQGRIELNLHRCLANCDADDRRGGGEDDEEKLTFCPAATLPAIGSTENPSVLASPGKSNAKSPASFPPQLPTTTSDDAAAPVLSPTITRRVLVTPAV